MNRRGFLHSLVGGIAATSAVRAWPFRVYSFPSEISFTDVQHAIDETALPLPIHHFSAVWYNPRALEALKRNLVYRRKFA